MASTATGAPISEESGNPRKIPTVIFIENVEEFCSQYGTDGILQQLNELYSKYKFMEAQLQRSKEVLKQKLPDINKSLEMVEYLAAAEGEEASVDFQLSDNIWTKATCKRNGMVNLWLGANVMLEYTYEDALTLLRKNLDGATTNLQSTDEDINFLKDQITTCEVNIARVYNQGVSERAKKGNTTAS